MKQAYETPIMEWIEFNNMERIAASENAPPIGMIPPGF